MKKNAVRRDLKFVIFVYYLFHSMTTLTFEYDMKSEKKSYRLLAISFCNLSM